ncbi:MAG: HAD-IA family hydrolase [Rubrivivax sp.]
MPSAADTRALLFDLDGTLVDSAPDLAGAANDLRADLGLPALPLAVLRPMVGAAFGVAPGDPRFDGLRDAFLARYTERLLQDTRVFDGIAAVLDALAARGLPWAVVTNKATRFAEPLLGGLGLLPACAVLVCGDTTPHAKPHPAPLLEAARRLAVAPARCVYVGDDLRDVQAGRAAGMGVLVAGWGYLGQGEPAGAWGADGVLADTEALLNWLHLP